MQDATERENAQAIIGTIRQFLTENGYLEGGTVADDESLFSSGLISSLAMVELIDLMEERYGFTTSPRDATLANLDTFESIARFIAVQTHT